MDSIFKNAKTIGEVNRIFRRHAAIHHPNKPGGRTENFQELQSAHNRARAAIQRNDNYTKQKQNWEEVLQQARERKQEMAQRMNKLQKQANESRTAHRQRYSRLPLIITKELRGETNRLRGLLGLPANAKTPRYWRDDFMVTTPSQLVKRRKYLMRIMEDGWWVIRGFMTFVRLEPQTATKDQHAVFRYLTAQGMPAELKVYFENRHGARFFPSSYLNMPTLPPTTQNIYLYALTEFQGQ